MPTPTTNSTTSSVSARSAHGRAGARRTSASAAGRSSRSRTRARRGRASRARASARPVAVQRSNAELVGDYAERAVLIPVGAALIAREHVVSTVGDLVAAYSSSGKIQTQLRRFERRGGVARNRLERRVRKTRTRAEREVRQRRRALIRSRQRLTKDLTAQVEQTQEQLQKTQARIEHAVRTRLEDGSDLAKEAQERVLSRV